MRCDVVLLLAPPHRRQHHYFAHIQPINITAKHRGHTAGTQQKPTKY